MDGVRRAPSHGRHTIVIAALGGALVTLLVTVLPFLGFAYRSPTLHVAIETTATLVALAAALLMGGRFARTRALPDLLLAAALGTLAVTNLFFSAIPAIAEAGEGKFDTWAPLAGRVLGTALFAAGALAPDRTVSRPPRRVLIVASAACLGAIATIALVLGLAGDRLPVGVDPGLSPESSSRPRVVGHPALLAVQLVTMALYAAAAAGLTRRAERNGDELMAWFAGGSMLAAFSRLNYFLFPSLYSEWVYAGDLLRLGFYLMLLIGAVRAVAVYQGQAAQVAVLEERRRVARDLHDGLAQELAYIASQSRRLDGVGAQSGLGRQLSDAADRALDESREAIRALAAPDEPLDAAIAAAAEGVAARAGAAVRLKLDTAPEVPAEKRQALVRIVREAVTNATRHGRASEISMELAAGEALRLRIQDNGKGFDPRDVDGFGFGLTSMRERAEALGGELEVASAPSGGTRVEVRLP